MLLGYEISVIKTQQSGIHNFRRFIRHENGFIEEWMSIFFLMITVAQNTVSVNIKTLQA